MTRSKEIHDAYMKGRQDALAEYSRTKGCLMYLLAILVSMGYFYMIWLGMHGLKGL